MAAVKLGCDFLDRHAFVREISITWDEGARVVSRRFSRASDGGGQVEVRTGAPQLPEVVAAIAEAMAERGPASAVLTVGGVGVLITRGDPRA